MTTVVEGHGYIYIEEFSAWVMVSCNCDITAKRCPRKTWIDRGRLEKGKRRKTTQAEELRLEERLQYKGITNQV